MPPVLGSVCLLHLQMLGLSWSSMGRRLSCAFALARLDVGTLARLRVDALERLDVVVPECRCVGTLGRRCVGTLGLRCVRAHLGLVPALLSSAAVGVARGRAGSQKDGWTDRGTGSGRWSGRPQMTTV